MNGPMSHHKLNIETESSIKRVYVFGDASTLSDHLPSDDLRGVLGTVMHVCFLIVLRYGVLILILILNIT